MTARSDARKLSSIASRNAITAVAARVSALVVGMILTPFVLHRLEAHLYGLVIAIGSVYEYLSLLRGGVGGALRRFVTYHHHAGRTEEAQAYYSAGFWWAGIFRGGILLVGLALAWPITGFFHLEAAARPSAALGIGLVFIASVLTDQGVMLTVPIYATGRMVVISLLQLCGGWLRLVIFAAALTWFGATLVSFGGAAVALELILLVGIVIAARRAGTIPRLFPRPQFGPPEVRRELFGYGRMAVLSEAACLLYLSSDNLFIGRIYGPDAVTHYSLGTRWMPLITGFIAATMSGVLPLFTSLDARGAVERSREALLRLLALTSALAFPLCLIPCVVGDLFLAAWVGPAYQDSWKYMVALLIPAAIDGALSPIWMSLLARGRIGWVAAGDILVAVGNVGISLILALPLGLGLLGFALGNTCAILVKNAIVLTIALRRDPTLPQLRTLLRPMPLAILGTVPALLALALARPLCAGSLAAVIGAGVVAGLLGLAGSVLATMGPGGFRRVAQLLPWRR